MLFFAINIHGKAIQGNKQTNSLPSTPQKKHNQKKPNKPNQNPPRIVF